VKSCIVYSWHYQLRIYISMTPLTKNCCVSQSVSKKMEFVSDRNKTAHGTFDVGHSNMTREFWQRLYESYVHVTFLLSCILWIYITLDCSNWVVLILLVAININSLSVMLKLRTLQFLPHCIVYSAVLATVKPSSIRPFVKRVNCDEINVIFSHIFTPRERSMT